MQVSKYPHDFDEEVSFAEDQIRALRVTKLGDASWGDMPIGFQNPHCDFSMVHAPGECDSCDTVAFALQHLRVINRVNFTGHHDPELAPCPSEIFRSFENANKWGGNHADVKNESLDGTDEKRSRKRWEEVLKDFQTFFNNERQLERLRHEREELENKIRLLDHGAWD